MSAIFGLQAVKTKVPTKDKGKGTPSAQRKGPPPPPATETAKPDNSPSILAVIGASAGLVGVLYASGREDMAERLIMPVAIGNVAYAAWKIIPGLVGGGGGGTGDETAARQEQAAEVRQQEIEQGPKPSWAESFYGDLADKIYNFLHGWAEDEAAAKGQLYYIYNDTDWNKLLAAYGNRVHDQVSTPLTSNAESLPTALRRYLPVAYISEINALFAKRGLKNRI